MLRFACPVPIWGQTSSFLFCPLSTSSAYRIISRVLRACWMLICHARWYCQFQRACRFWVEDIRVWCIQCERGSRIFRPGIRRLFRLQMMMLPHSRFFGRWSLLGRSISYCLSILSERWRMLDFVPGEGLWMLHLRLFWGWWHWRDSEWRRQYWYVSSPLTYWIWLLCW